MKTIQILGANDVVQLDDWCRPLELSALQNGETPEHDAYSGTPQNNVLWVQAKHVFGPFWFASPTTVRDLWHAIGTRYEFVRGDVPSGHRLDMRRFNSAAR